MAKYLTDFRQGDTKLIKIDYGVGIDISGFVFMFTMRVDFDEAISIVAQIKSTAGDHSLDDVINGIAYLELDSTTSASIPAGGYVYDIQRVKPNGGNPLAVLTLTPPVADFDDVLTVAPQVTRVNIP